MPCLDLLSYENAKEINDVLDQKKTCYMRGSVCESIGKDRMSDVIVPLDNAIWNTDEMIDSTYVLNKFILLMRLHHLEMLIIT